MTEKLTIWIFPKSELLLLTGLQDLVLLNSHGALLCFISEVA